MYSCTDCDRDLVYILQGLFAGPADCFDHEHGMPSMQFTSQMQLGIVVILTTICGSTSMAKDDLIVHWLQGQAPPRAARQDTSCTVRIGNEGQTLSCALADFGVPPPNSGISGGVALPRSPTDSGCESAPSDTISSQSAGQGACHRGARNNSRQGKIAIVRADGCPFVAKALAAQADGAIGLVVVSRRVRPTRMLRPSSNSDGWWGWVDDRLCQRPGHAPACARTDLIRNASSNDESCHVQRVRVRAGGSAAPVTIPCVMVGASDAAELIRVATSSAAAAAAAAATLNIQVGTSARGDWDLAPDVLSAQINISSGISAAGWRGHTGGDGDGDGNGSDDDIVDTELTPGLALQKLLLAYHRHRQQELLQVAAHARCKAPPPPPPYLHRSALSLSRALLQEGDAGAAATAARIASAVAEDAQNASTATSLLCAALNAQGWPWAAGCASSNPLRAPAPLPAPSPAPWPHRLRRIAVTFAGRAPALRILSRYMFAALRRQLIDSWHLWDYTRCAADAMFLASLPSRAVQAGLDTDAVRVLRPKPASLIGDGVGPAAVFSANDTGIGVRGIGRSGKDTGHGEEVAGGTWRAHKHGFTAAYRYYAHRHPRYCRCKPSSNAGAEACNNSSNSSSTGGGCLEFDDALILKIDDDVLFMDLDRLEPFLRWRERERGAAAPFFIAANTINNGVCAFHQQRVVQREISHHSNDSSDWFWRTPPIPKCAVGTAAFQREIAEGRVACLATLPYPGTERGGSGLGRDGVLWTSGHMAEALHRVFLRSLHRSFGREFWAMRPPLASHRHAADAGDTDSTGDRGKVEDGKASVGADVDRHSDDWLLASRGHRRLRLHSSGFPPWLRRTFVFRIPDAFSVNCITWLGRDSEMLANIGMTDERSLTDVPKRLVPRRHNFVFGGFVVSHYSFFPQWAHMRQSGVFSDYENLVCGDERETVLEAEDLDHDDICSQAVAQAEVWGGQSESNRGSGDDNDSEIE